MLRLEITEGKKKLLASKACLPELTTAKTFESAALARKGIEGGEKWAFVEETIVGGRVEAGKRGGR